MLLSQYRGLQGHPNTAFQDSLNQTQLGRKSVRELLGNDLVNIEYDSNGHITITQRNGYSQARFSINIDGEEYTIAVIMDEPKISACPTFPDRPHPFITTKPSLQITSFIKSDIHPDSVLLLFKKGDTTPIRTNKYFWKGIRERIPSQHPLSTNQN